MNMPEKTFIYFHLCEIEGGGVWGLMNTKLSNLQNVLNVC